MLGGISGGALSPQVDILPGVVTASGETMMRKNRYAGEREGARVQATKGHTLGLGGLPAAAKTLHQGCAAGAGYSERQEILTGRFNEAISESTDGLISKLHWSRYVIAMSKWMSSPPAFRIVSRLHATSVKNWHTSASSKSTTEDLIGVSVAEP